MAGRRWSEDWCTGIEALRGRLSVSGLCECSLERAGLLPVTIRMANTIAVGVDVPSLGESWILLVTLFAVVVSIEHVAGTFEFTRPGLNLDGESRHGGHGRQGVFIREVANPNTLRG